MAYTLEVIAFNIESCAMAQAAGAHRIELCDNPDEGGTTPSYGFIKAARQLLHIDLYPIIRPRGGDFHYSDAEFEIMKSDVLQCKQLGCDGVVIGLLLEDGNVDIERTSLLRDLAYPMSVTFHRAFDRTANPKQALEDIIQCGCDRILTSGQQTTAMAGLALLNELIQLADDRIEIMPGSGLRSDNIAIIAKETGATAFHSSARIKKASTMQFIQKNMNEKLEQVVLNEQEVKDMIQALNLLS
jgi:copper homeostasis protein